MQGFFFGVSEGRKLAQFASGKKEGGEKGEGRYSKGA